MDITFSLYFKRDVDQAVEALTALRPVLQDPQPAPDWAYGVAGQAMQGVADGTTIVTNPLVNLHNVTVEIAEGYTPVYIDVEGYIPDAEPKVTNGDLPPDTFTKDDAKAAMAALATEAAEVAKAKRTRRTKAEMDAARAAETATAAAVVDPQDVTYAPVVEDLVVEPEVVAVEPTIEDLTAEPEADDSAYTQLLAGLVIVAEEPAEFASKTDDQLRAEMIGRLKDRANYGATWMTRVMTESGVTKPGDFTRAVMIKALSN